MISQHFIATGNVYNIKSTEKHPDVIKTSADGDFTRSHTFLINLHLLLHGILEEFFSEIKLMKRG